MRFQFNEDITTATVQTLEINMTRKLKNLRNPKEISRITHIMTKTLESYKIQQFFQVRILKKLKVFFRFLESLWQEKFVNVCQAWNVNLMSDKGRCLKHLR